MASFKEKLDAKVFGPLDFSSILGYPDELSPKWIKHTPKFQGHNDSTTLYVTSFMELISDLNVVHEDVMKCL